MTSVTKPKMCVQLDHPNLQKLGLQFWNCRTNYLRLGLFMQVLQVSRCHSKSKFHLIDWHSKLWTFLCRCLWTEKYGLYESTGHLGIQNTFQRIRQLYPSSRAQVCLFLQVTANFPKRKTDVCRLEWWWVESVLMCVFTAQFQRCWCHGNSCYGHETEGNVHCKAVEFHRCNVQDWGGSPESEICRHVQQISEAGKHKKNLHIQMNLKHFSAILSFVLTVTK